MLVEKVYESRLLKASHEEPMEKSEIYPERQR